MILLKILNIFHIKIIQIHANITFAKTEHDMEQHEMSNLEASTQLYIIIAH